MCYVPPWITKDHRWSPIDHYSAPWTTMGSLGHQGVCVIDRAKVAPTDSPTEAPLVTEAPTAPTQSPTPSPTYAGGCADIEGWNNNHGFDCEGYASRWCQSGAAKPGQEWTLGSRFNFPEENCCVCGRGPQVSRIRPWVVPR